MAQSEPERPETTVHGYEILKSKFIAGEAGYLNGWIIIAKPGDNVHHPYVTWWMNEHGGCRGGEYCRTLAEAEASFEARR